MTAHTTPTAPGALDDDEQDAFEAEFHDGPPVAGVAFIASAVCVIVWVGLSLALMTAIDRYAPLYWSVK